MVNRKSFKQFSPELSILLSLAKSNSVDDEKINSMLERPIDWNLFLELAKHHRVFPTVYQTLAAYNHPSIPAYVIKALQQEYTKNAFKAIGMAGEMVRVIRCFEENGIKPLVLKGSPLALKLYGDVALRPSHDIDILVEPGCLEKAGMLLTKAGYKKNHQDFSLTPRQQKAHLKRFHHFSYTNADRKICLELHWKINAIDLKYHTLSNSITSQIEVAGYSMPVLADEELFMYLMVHGARHMWFRLRWLCDIERFMRQENGLDWDRIIFLAKHSGQSIILYQTMILGKELFNLPIPDCLAIHVVDNPETWMLAKTVIDNLFDRAEQLTSPRSSYWRNFMVKNSYNLKIQPGRNKKLFYLLSLFEPNANDFRLISLPDSLYPVYYLIRPFAWLGRRINRI